MKMVGEKPEEQQFRSHTLRTLSQTGKLGKVFEMFENRAVSLFNLLYLESFDFFNKQM